MSELQNANEGLFADLDFSTLSVDYASKTGIFSPDNAAERARVVRRWLRDRPEKEIVGEYERRVSNEPSKLSVQSSRTAISYDTSCTATTPLW